MKVITSIKEMQEYVDKVKGLRGFIPTMGFLHDGHISLLKKARNQCDIVIVSIFVNPMQFGPDEDLDKYPRDLDSDKILCEQVGVDVLFHPSVEDIYPENYLTYVNVDEIVTKLCGASRPIHFRGVTTVLTKLFNIVRPHKAYFGQKDYQQTLIIKQLVNDLNFNTEVVVCPIVRDKNSLAVSSRNMYLSKEEKEQALVLNQALTYARSLVANGETDAAKVKKIIEDMIKEKPLAKIDYVEIVNPANLETVEKIEEGNALIALAVYFGKARLIDNILV